MLVVLLEYIDSFSLSGIMKRAFGEATLPFTILYYCIFILSIAIVFNYAYFSQICAYYAGILFFTLPSHYSNNFAGKNRPILSKFLIDKECINTVACCVDNIFINLYDYWNRKPRSHIIHTTILVQNTAIHTYMPT